MTPAEELRAAATKVREHGTAAGEATMTGRGDEWNSWSVVQNMRVDETRPPVEVDDEIFGPMKMPVYEPTGTATVTHAVYAHNTEEDWYENTAVTSKVLPPVAEWIALVDPGLAEPLALLLEDQAAMYEEFLPRGEDVAERIVWHGLGVARSINGGAQQAGGS